MSNRLQHETSPYLRQHADNPVDWYPWGEEALARARQEDKPIMLSIGYASCHWCHVMAHESFENPETARLMNESFVNIKVDREERPDLDTIYMEAVQALTGSGGWPLTVFLTPELKPFFGGTYYPPAARFGLPGFPQLLRELAEDYRQRRRETQNSADRLLSQMAPAALRGGGQLPGAEALGRAYQELRRACDETHGGFGGPPKFPQPMLPELLLRLHRRGNGGDALLLAETNLQQMAAGGIYDQLGGGFHRYSVDQYWTVPHFEKMLYDNAQLARLYARAYVVTGKALYRRVAEETLDYLRRDLQAPTGGHYAAQDADSPGGEGAFYVWRPEQVRAVLGEAEGDLACRYFDIGEHGNFEGQSIPTRRGDPAALARQLGIPLAELEARAAAARPRLREARERRPRPGTDTKVLANWNGLVLSALATAGAALGRADYLEAAADLGRYLRSQLLAGDRLWHVADGQGGKIEGFLQDYAFVAEGYLALYEATLWGEWLQTARSLATALVARFWSERDGCFYDTGEGHEALIVRPRTLFDNALPSGGSAATLLLLRLAALEGRDDYRRIAEAALAPVLRAAPRQPLGFGYWLSAFDFATEYPQELVILGDPSDPATGALLAAWSGVYRPNLLVLGQEGAEGSPLLAGRTAVDGRPTAYYCTNFACLPPTSDPAELRRLLEE